MRHQRWLGPQSAVHISWEAKLKDVHDLSLFLWIEKTNYSLPFSAGRSQGNERSFDENRLRPSVISWSCCIDKWNDGASKLIFKFDLDVLKRMSPCLLENQINISHHRPEYFDAKHMSQIKMSFQRHSSRWSKELISGTLFFLSRICSPCTTYWSTKWYGRSFIRILLLELWAARVSKQIPGGSH